MYTRSVDSIKGFFFGKKSFNYINFFLVAAIITGLILKFISWLNYPLNSDSVYSGLASLEIWEYGNYFLYFYFTPHVTPYYFTDIYTIQLVPQVLTDFNPLALKFMGFLLFCFIILTFSYIVFRISGNVVNSFVFAALISNLPAGSFEFYVQYFHIGTVFFTGVVIVLLFDFPKVKVFRYFSALILILITLFSDSLVLIWLIVPGLLYYAYLTFFSPTGIQDAKKKEQMDLSGLWFVVLTVISSITVMIYKMTFIPYFVRSVEMQLVDFSTFFHKAVIFIKQILLLFQSAIYEMLTSPSKMDLLDYLCVVVSVVLILYCLFKNGKNVPKKILIFGLFAGMSSFFFFAATTVSQEVRYLLFLGILIFVMISLCYQDHDTVFLIILFGVLILNAASSVQYISTQNTYPNQNEYELIQYLQSRGLNQGIGDYWDANIITYLSKENVTIRPAVGAEGYIVPFTWLTSARWYEKYEMNKVNFILITNTSAANRPFLNRENIGPYLETHQPNNTQVWNNYLIYEY